MHIFIDDAGAFAAVPPARPRHCAYAAAVVRSDWLPGLLLRFAELRTTWGNAGAERKGSKLSERQMAQALRLFRAYDVTAFCAVIDTGMHPPEALKAFREGQATGFTDMLKRMTRPHPKFIEQVQGFASRWRHLSDPLTMQMYTAVATVEDVIKLGSVYFAANAPKENSEFRWTVDRKGADGLTDSEELWRSNVCPILQTTFLESPPFSVSGAGHDYSYFDKAFSTGETELPDYLKSHLKPGIKPRTPGVVFDLKKLMLEHLTFDVSANNAGLQVADIIGSAVTRALNRTIRWEGWNRVAHLFLHQKSGPLRLIALGPEPDEGRVPVNKNVHRVQKLINDGAKSIHGRR